MVRLLYFKYSKTNNTAALLQLHTHAVLMMKLLQTQNTILLAVEKYVCVCVVQARPVYIACPT